MAFVSARRLCAGRRQRNGRGAPAGSCRPAASGPGWRSRPSAAHSLHPSTPSPASGDAAGTTQRLTSCFAGDPCDPSQGPTTPDDDRQALHVHGEHTAGVLGACRRAVQDVCKHLTSSKERAPPSLPTRISSSQPQCRSTCAAMHDRYQHGPWPVCNSLAPPVLMKVSQPRSGTSDLHKIAWQPRGTHKDDTARPPQSILEAWQSTPG